jgi:Holliday junction resolvase RusA-like endonuclease
MFRLTLPLPPSVNAAYFNRKTGGRGLTAAARKWKADAQSEIMVARSEQQYDFPLEQRVLVLVKLWFGSDGKRDVDNCLKLTIDALASMFFFNDVAVIAPIPLLMGIDARNPRMEIAMWTVPEDAWQAATERIAASVEGMGA